MKTFAMMQDNGSRREVPQLDTLSMYIGGYQYRFVVLDVDGNYSVTHRDSGCRAAFVSIPDAKHAREAIENLVKQYGAERVRAVLDKAAPRQ